MPQQKRRVVSREIERSRDQPCGRFHGVSDCVGIPYGVATTAFCKKGTPGSSTRRAMHTWGSKTFRVGHTHAERILEYSTVIRFSQNVPISHACVTRAIGGQETYSVLHCRSWSGRHGNGREASILETEPIRTSKIDRVHPVMDGYQTKPHSLLSQRSSPESTPHSVQKIMLLGIGQDRQAATFHAHGSKGLRGGHRCLQQEIPLC